MLYLFFLFCIKYVKTTLLIAVAAPITITAIVIPKIVGMGATDAYFIASL